MEGNYADWRRFQYKCGRSATLNQTFNNKDRWFKGKPRDLGEKLKFSYSQI